MVVVPRLDHGESAQCPRCCQPLIQRVPHSVQQVLAYTGSALLMLLFALPFTFASFEIQSVQQQISITQIATMLFYDNQLLLALIVALAILIFPSLFLVGIGYLYMKIAFNDVQAWQRPLARLVMRLHPWMMADVFLIGVLVSLSKVANMADIGLGLSFWAFCVFVILLLKTVTSIDIDRFWFALAGEPEVTGITPGRSAGEQNAAGCHLCAYPVVAAAAGRCPRCGEQAKPVAATSIEKTRALLLAAAVLYIPANLLPVMQTVSWGVSTPQTIIGGIVYLAENGSLPIAVIIFIASIVIPIAKLLTLGWLCHVAGRPAALDPPGQLRLYRVTSFIGRWSMIDVFVVATLTALIQTGFLLSMAPGPGILPFAAVVVITMIAAMQFDARLLWSRQIRIGSR